MWIRGNNDGGTLYDNDDNNQTKGDKKLWINISHTPCPHIKTKWKQCWEKWWPKKVIGTVKMANS